MDDRIALYFSADELRDALKMLGPTGDRAEATVAIAAETLATLIEDDGEMYAWDVEHHLDAASARQAGRPHVELVRILREPDWEE